MVKEKSIFLTFDDGPIPEVTPWVLSMLNRYNAKATFFCVGDNILKHPNLFEEIINQGHSVGNHTFNHLNGWNHDDENYLQNVLKCESITNTKIFRPPYGKIKNSQAKILTNKGFKIFMWDVLSGDFDPKLSPQNCLSKTIKNTSEGSMIVFHDNIKSFEKLKHVLPRFLEHFYNLGYEFKSIEVPQLTVAK